MIVNELTKLKKYSLDDLKKMRNEMYDICDYNQKHFIELINENWKTHNSKVLENHLYKIWGEVKK